MTFLFFERLSLELTVFLGILLIAVTGEVQAAYWMAALLCMIAGSLSLSRRNRPLLAAVTLPTVIIIGFTLFDVLILTPNYLVAAIHLVLLLLSLKFLGERRVVDNLQMLGLSFLLVLGASAITVEAVYGLLLLVYVFSGLWAMLLQNLRGHWESAVGDFESLGRRRGMLGGAFGAAVLVLGFGILLFTLVFYFAFPRIGMQFWKSPEGYARSISGFSETVRLNDRSKIQTNPALALRVVYGEGNVPPEASPLRRLRGIVLDRFDGMSWSDSRPVPENKALPFDGTRWHLEPSRSTAWNAWVTPESEYAAVLFVPLGAAQIEGNFRTIRRLESGNFSVARPPRKKLGYRVSVTTQVESEAPLPAHLEVPVSISARVGQLAVKWAGEKTGKDLAEVLSERLIRDYHYTTELAQSEAGSPVENFLFGTKSGHCELFASSLAVLLRTRGVPTRIVNGFAGGEDWGDDSVVFRELHAHSWVEAFIEGEGWVEYDPTPSTTLDLPWTVQLTKAYYTMQARLHYFWGEWFVDFDHERQARMAKEIKRASIDMVGALNGLKAPSGEWFRKRPVSMGIAGLFTALAIGLGIRRYRYRFRAVASSRLTKIYARKLRLARKIRIRQPGETLLEHAQEITRLDNRWNEFESYTRLYYKLRFGKASSADGIRFLEMHAGVPRKKNGSQD